MDKQLDVKKLREYIENISQKVYDFRDDIMLYKRLLYKLEIKEMVDKDFVSQTEIIREEMWELVEGIMRILNLENDLTYIYLYD